MSKEREAYKQKQCYTSADPVPLHANQHSASADAGIEVGMKGVERVAQWRKCPHGSDIRMAWRGISHVSHMAASGRTRVGGAAYEIPRFRSPE